MRTFDFTPVLRPTIGYGTFGRLFNELERASTDSSQPSYDVKKSADDKYEIVIAAPGFGEDDIEITLTQNTLAITAKSEAEDSSENGNVEYLHRGLTNLSLDYRFDLSDNIKVMGAEMDKGLLKISLQKEIPEALKPQTIKIGKPGNLIEGKAA
ncbi:Hsp20 family protein [Sneathiella glossodoripedis]|uniref:Hsp20 family protein n=1 Tax=Sneathiella glossodoripedis TaxID=418853 RepID=UPI00046E61F5|nr:Hsp20 family protein [Sneathiella glossodoripedis]